MDKQTTIKSLIKVDGVNIYNGRPNYAIFHPAKENSGLKFWYGNETIPALIEYAVPKKFGIALRGKNLEVMLVEHPMSAAYGAGLDNAVIELSDGVCPTVNNCAEEYFMPLKFGLELQNADKKMWKYAAKDNWAMDTYGPFNGKPDSLMVDHADGFLVSYHAEYASKGIGPQNARMGVTPYNFETKIMSARPPVMDIPMEWLNRPFLWLGKRGMHGITEKNYLFTQPGINPEGFGVRYDGKEFVRHKMLDAIGALALTGMRFNQTSFRFNMTGHSFDLLALKDLMSRGIFTEYTGPKNRVALRDKSDPNTL